MRVYLLEFYIKMTPAMKPIMKFIWKFWRENETWANNRHCFLHSTLYTDDFCLWTEFSSQLFFFFFPLCSIYQRPIGICITLFVITYRDGFMLEFVKLCVDWHRDRLKDTNTEYIEYGAQITIIIISRIRISK